MTYRIAYIDGHDLRYKLYETAAESPEDAVQKLRDSYDDGDFDHQIIAVLQMDHELW